MDFKTLSRRSLVEKFDDNPVSQLQREKSKRPQLSCNSCRMRKVKCDRIQPCTACSLHQIADRCAYDLSESERHPILQAEALREKDKEIARLQLQVLAMGGTNAKSDTGAAFQDIRKRRKSGSQTVRTPKKPYHAESGLKSDIEEASFPGFGVSSSMSTILNELSDLSIHSKVQGRSNGSSSELDVCIAASNSQRFPFPTLWAAKEGVFGLVELLPSKQELSVYLESFRSRVYPCIFPYLPKLLGRPDIHHYMASADQEAQTRPDALSLLFAAIALGVQYGVPDEAVEDTNQNLIACRYLKVEAYVAASMQCLRLASFLSRPSLLAVEALSMIGILLMNSGKVSDSWSLFGVTIRLAQAIDLHKDPPQTRNSVECQGDDKRQALWWLILFNDQQFSLALGKPLGIPKIGRSWSPDILGSETLAKRIADGFEKLTLVSRDVVSSENINGTQSTHYIDTLSGLSNSLLSGFSFSRSWLNDNKSAPPWPYNAQIARLHIGTQALILILHRQRLEGKSDSFLRQETVTTLEWRMSIDYDGIVQLSSCCLEVLDVFEYLRLHLRSQLVCWIICQQAFNAANLLVLFMLATGDASHYSIAQRAYETFVEIHQQGIQRFLGPAVESLRKLMRDIDPRRRKQTIPVRPQEKPKLRTQQPHKDQYCQASKDQALLGSTCGSSTPTELQDTFSPTKCKVGGFHTIMNKKLKLNNQKLVKIKSTTSPEICARKTITPAKHYYPGLDRDAWPKSFNNTFVTLPDGQSPTAISKSTENFNEAGGAQGSSTAPNDQEDCLAASVCGPAMPNAAPSAGRTDVYSQYSGGHSDRPATAFSSIPPGVSTVTPSEYQNQHFNVPPFTVTEIAGVSSARMDMFSPPSYANSSSSSHETTFESHSVSHSTTPDSSHPIYYLNHQEPQAQTPIWGFDQVAENYLSNHNSFALGESVKSCRPRITVEGKTCWSNSSVCYESLK